MNTEVFIFRFTVILVLLLVSCGQAKEKTTTKPLVERTIKFDVLEKRDTTIRFGKSYLDLAVGNIRGKQAKIVLKRDKLIILETYIHPKENIVFSINKKNYKLTCERLQNLLIAHDFGTFTISKTKEALSASNNLLLEQEKIVAMLDFIRNSDITFVRNGRSYPPNEAYNHLKVKYKRMKSKIKSLDQFITEIATRSFITDRLYKVRLKDRKTIYMKDWLNEVKDSI